MMPRATLLLLCLAWTGAPVLAQQSATADPPVPPEQPIAAELRLRDTSFYVGSTFHFYIQVTGVEQADLPLLEKAGPSLQIRYVGAAASNSRGLLAYTFTYEALPLEAGSLTIPGSELKVRGRILTTPPRTVDVARPVTTDAMELRLSLSRKECFVGEPVELTVSWTSSLSFNGVRAVDLRLPILSDSHFQVKPPASPVDPDDSHAIGLPVADQRMIARYSETTLGGQPALELSFEVILIPVQASSLSLLLPPATLLCSYSEPAKARFQGTRYPSYFNNDFFDQDVTGAFQRLFVQAPPATIRIKPLPAEQRPESFAGIVGPFTLTASADPLTVPALSPIALKLTASGYPFPHLLDLPPWNRHVALSRAFLIPEEDPKPERGRVQADGDVEFTVSLRPRSEATVAVPSLEFSYFDPGKETYEVVRTPEIPLTVTPATAATVYDLEFADGSRLRNEVEPIPGGVTHNVLDGPLLASQTPHTWTLQPWVWLLAFGLPPLLYLLLFRLSLNHRKARANPELARRELAFRRFRKALHRLPSDAPPLAINQLLRAYFADRFELATLAGEVPDLAGVARRMGVDADSAGTLTGIIARTDLHAFARNGSNPASLEKRQLVALVRRFEAKAVKPAIWFAWLSLALSSWGASPGDTLREAQAFFDKANEAALVNPAQAQGLYRLAASRFEFLASGHGIRNGQLYYNIGNTYFLAGDVGRALVNYLRAELYIPNDPQLGDALREARLRQVDHFPRAAPTRMRKILLFWHYHLGPSGRFLIVAMAAAGIWSILAWHLFVPLAWRWKACAYLAGVILLASGSSWIHSRSDPRKAAVVVLPEVLPRKGDAHVYDSAFTNPLHSGAEIHILEQRRDWLRIRVEDGSQGWIPASAVERVVP